MTDEDEFVEELGLLPNLTVYEKEPDVIDTGLLDQYGNPITYIEASLYHPIGFLWHDAEGKLRLREEFQAD